jgi:tetratricopeptide (TPR) repeat protein
MKNDRPLLLLFGIVGVLLLAKAAPQVGSANAELNLGVQSYKEGKFDEAIAHFQRAIVKDPSSVKSRLYLATTYAQQYIPGAETAENRQRGERAIDEYKAVLNLDSSNMNAMKGVAYLNLMMKKFDTAEEYYRKATELDPKDPENFYSIGMMDWTRTYQPRTELRAKLGLKPEEPLIDKTECGQLREANLKRVTGGIESLKKAIELKPDYDDAMAYMNLMYRERADIQCGDPKANAEDLKSADDWVDLTLITKKKNEAEAAKQLLQPADTQQ